MHPWRQWFAVGLIAPCVAAAAVIYKWTDSAGVVHFSDQAVPGAEKIITSSGTTNGIGGDTAAAGGRPPLPPPRNQPAGTAALVLSIEAPSKEEVFFGDDTIPVRLHLQPGLQQNQTVTWHLNGRQLDDQSNAVTFVLAALPRGTYTIAATVTNAVTGEDQSTEGVTFYVRQPSELAPQHKKD